MSNTQDIDTNAQTTDDQDVEAHGHLAGSDQDALSPRGIHRNDAPDGEDDVEGHLFNRGRSDQDAMTDALSPRGIHRNDAPDGEDSTTLGHDRK